MQKTKANKIDKEKIKQNSTNNTKTKQPKKPKKTKIQDSYNKAPDGAE